MLSQTLQLKSSYPANRSLPDLEKATEVIPARVRSLPDSRMTSLLTTDDVIMGVHGKLLIGADIEESARRIVGSRSEGVSRGEEL